MNKTTTKSLYRYSGLILIISTIWAIIFPISIGIYSAIFNGIFGFGIFFIWSQSNFYKFSEKLEKYHPDIFLKNTLWYGSFKSNRLYAMSLFTESSIYKKLQPKELHAAYRISMLSYMLALFHFLMTIVIAVGLIYWNYYME